MVSERACTSVGNNELLSHPCLEPAPKFEANIRVKSWFITYANENSMQHILRISI